MEGRQRLTDAQVRISQHGSEIFYIRFGNAADKSCLGREWLVAAEESVNHESLLQIWLYAKAGRALFLDVSEQESRSKSYFPNLSELLQPLEMSFAEVPLCI